MVYTLVYPEEADILAGKISVLAPIGMAILGYREKDRGEWATIRYKPPSQAFRKYAT
nr:GreA/GreB family elongation factor [Sporomusa acidovorans]